MNEEIVKLARVAAQEIYSYLIDKFINYVNKHGRQEAIDKCGIPDSTVSRWANKKNKERKLRPNLENTLRLIYGLDVSAVEIISLLNKHKKLPDVPPEKEEKPQKKHTVVK